MYVCMYVRMYVGMDVDNELVLHKANIIEPYPPYIHTYISNVLSTSNKSYDK